VQAVHHDDEKIIVGSQGAFLYKWQGSGQDRKAKLMGRFKTAEKTER
jgi:hypothetical protein